MTIAEEGATKLQHRANLLSVYVTPSVRGKRVGTTLLQEVIEYSKRLPHVENRKNLTVVSTNEAAIK